jgi:hypothetical protein
LHYIEDEANTAIIMGVHNNYSRQARPVVKLKLRVFDIILEIAGWLLLLAGWLLPLWHYHRLPEQIPIHFNWAGQIDRMGEKWMIWIAPAVATILFLGLTLLNRYPQIFNYPTRITAQNAYRQYALATRLIRYLKTIVVLILGIISLQVITSAEGESFGIVHGFLPLLLLLVFIPTIYFIIKSLKYPG